jgi:hypothetical protein
MKIANIQTCLEAVKIYNAAVNDVAKVKAVTAWVGLVENNGSYVNFDGKIVNVPWADGEPNNAEDDEGCVAVDEVLWGYNDVFCGTNLNYICERLEQNA